MAVTASHPVRSRRARLAARVFLPVIAALGVVLSSSVMAVAAPTPSSTDLMAQINQQWNALEPLIENYDGVHEKLLQQQAKAKTLQNQIVPLQLEVQLKLSRVGGIAANVYKSGPSVTMSMLLNAHSSEEAINVLGMVEQMASYQKQAVSGAMTLQAQYQAKKAPIDALVASLTTQQAALNQQKQQIQTKINQLNAELAKAYPNGQGADEPVRCPQVYNGDPGSKAALFACKQIGKPYVWDTAGPRTYDCSGLTMAAWASVGVTLPHNAYAQKQDTRAVRSASALQPGDLVFYYPGISHVTIYVGNGWVVSAPTTGDVVRMKRYNSITPNGYGRP